MLGPAYGLAGDEEAAEGKAETPEGGLETIIKNIIIFLDNRMRRFFFLLLEEREATELNEEGCAELLPGRIDDVPASLGNAVRTELAEVGEAAETVLDVPDEAAAETSETEGSLCELLVAFVIVAEDKASEALFDPAEDSANVSLLLQKKKFFVYLLSFAFATLRDMIVRITRVKMIDCVFILIKMMKE